VGPRARIASSPARAVAALGLPTALTPPASPLTDARWEHLLHELERRRLAGALAEAIAAESFPATSAQRQAAMQAQRTQCARDLVLERHLVDCHRALAARDVDAMVLKGPALARLAYTRPAMRSFRDIDLLVPADRIDEAVNALVAAGGRRHYPEPRPGFDATFSKGVAITTPPALELDLHRTLAAGVHGQLIPPEDLWRDARTLAIGDRSILAPSSTVLALHACVHAVLGDPWPRLENLRDVAVTVLHPDTELAAVLEVARRWHAETVVAFAVAAAWTELDLDPDLPAGAWARAHRPDRRALRRLGPYLGEHRSYPRQALGTVPAIPGWADRARYLRAIMVPDHARRSRVERWRRGLASLRSHRDR
jgi:hypothetical protein